MKTNASEGQWFDFETNKELFEKAANGNCLCKFDDGNQGYFDDTHPFAVLTHFYVAAPSTESEFIELTPEN